MTDQEEMLSSTDENKYTLEEERSEDQYHSNLSRLTIRHEKASEMVALQPGYIVRQGIFIFFIVFVCIAGASWFIQYPDIVNVNAILTSVNPPKKIIARQSGRLTNLFVKGNEFVTKGELLGTIESTADYISVLALSGAIDSMQILLNQNKDSLIPSLIKTYNNLGDLQSAYQSFTTAYLQFQQSLPGGLLIEKRNLLLKDFNNTLLQNNSLVSQEKIQEQDFALAKKQFEANKKLYEEKVISDFDFNNEKSKIIAKTLNMSQIHAGIIGAASTIISKKSAIVDLDNQIEQQRFTFMQTIATCKAQIDNWKQNYLISTPIDGTVSFINILQVNQYVQASQLLFYINTVNTAYFMQATLGQSNFGKVHVGQKVLLKFPAYPSEEYGSVYGAVSYISNVPSDSGFLCEISLSDGLITDFHRTLIYKDNLIASGQIITKKHRLLEKLLFKSRSFFKQN